MLLSVTSRDSVQSGQMTSSAVSLSPLQSTNAILRVRPHSHSSASRSTQSNDVFAELSYSSVVHHGKRPRTPALIHDIFHTAATLDYCGYSSAPLLSPDSPALHPRTLAQYDGAASARRDTRRPRPLVAHTHTRTKKNKNTLTRRHQSRHDESRHCSRDCEGYGE